MKTLILTRQQIKPLLSMSRAIRAVEEVFKVQGQNKVQMPAKIYLDLKKYHGDFRAMPAFVESLNAVTLKWVNSHSQNAKFQMPAVMAVLILSDPRNGFPLCIMDGTYATDIRTGAAGAVAAKYLASKDSKVVSLVGCGRQAQTQLEALEQLFKIEQVRVWGHEEVVMKSFKKVMPSFRRRMVLCPSIKECVTDGDIVVTTTPSRKPIVKLNWLKKNVHVNAIGADAAGKQELDPMILKKGKVVIDDWAQASHSGEINVPLKKKQISRWNVYAELGELVSRKKPFAPLKNTITVFDSTGLAVQDTAVAHLIYKEARKKKTGKLIQLV
ncbi:MAG: ornithine cyclodeaminase family protein [Candidatus Omnitrophica bacterium]|nr:ornithine cyclodeaminase family protein [Candidatus Omnitrophota bacterium]